jgi:2-polyprenyl-6-methoxyphenol hydroxylase-like FAD-dependent oxidoreductase
MYLLPAVERRGYQVREVRFVDTTGRRVGGFGVDVFRRMTGGRFVSLLRGDLAELIYQGVEGRCETMFGDSITDIEQSDGGVRVAFAHGPERRFDLVIGADGLHSVVRNLVFGRQHRVEHYLGYVVAAFAADGYRPHDEDVYVSYTLPGKQVARFAMRDDRTMFLFVLHAADPPMVDPHDIGAQKRILHAAFDQAGWECREIMAALDATHGLYFDRVSQIRMPTWSRGRVALTGDAAFCPSLLAGQGAALAMTSATVLAGELAAAHGRYPIAFERQEQVLRSFIDGKQVAAERFAGAFAPRTRLGLWLRNQVTKALSFPLVAELVIGRSLVDRLELPAYAGLGRVAGA